MAKYIIDFNRLEVYEAGAMLVTLLAYPDAREEEQRAEVHASLCHHALWIKRTLEPDWELSPQPIKPIYALHTPTDRYLITLPRRLRDRMAAGRMAMGFLKEAVTGRTPELPAGISRVSINQMARLVVDDVGQASAANIPTRVWRPSLPVIHLATAFQAYLDFVERRGGCAFLETFLLNPRAIECVVGIAVAHAAILAQKSRLRIDPARLIEIRLAESH